MIKHATFLLALLTASSAQASAPDAWAAFRADVRAKCLAGAVGMRAPTVVVHPVGTPSKGVAVLIAGTDKRICIYDKQAKTVELTPAI